MKRIVVIFIMNTKRLLLCLTFLSTSVLSLCQSTTVPLDTKYAYTLTPDVWFNSIDGITPGLRINGYKPVGYAFKHRINAGLWLASKFPAKPASYYVSYENALTSTNSGFENIILKLRSSYRAGLILNNTQFKKRFNHQSNGDASELMFTFQIHHYLENDYLLFPLSWKANKSTYSTEVVYVNNDLKIRNVYLLNARSISLNAEYLFSKRIISFLSADVRFFGHVATTQLYPEYRMGLSASPPVEWEKSPYMRSRGVLSTSFISNGYFGFINGGGMRGYYQHDFNEFKNDGFMNYPGKLITILLNIRRDLFVSDFMNWSLFGLIDVGSSFKTGYMKELLLSNAGFGSSFSVNIPNYLNKSRGFTVNYEVPLWVSYPYNSENNLKLRHLISFTSHFYF